MDIVDNTQIGGIEKLYTFTDDEHNILSPQYYLHTAILSALRSIPNSLMNGRLEDGMVGYILSISSAEYIAMAMGILDEEVYEKTIREFKEKSVDRGKGLNFDKKLSDLKLRLIIEGIMESKPRTEPLQI